MNGSSSNPGASLTWEPDPAAATARLYLVAPARLDAAWLHEVVGELADAGVDLIQLREKDMEAGDVLRVGEPIAAACKEVGIPLLINDRADLALALDADGVHLGQDDGPVWLARRVLDGGLVGLSTHAQAEVDAATSAADRSDYIAVGPVHATPTKPGRPAVGLELVRYAARRAELPWFAIGGIDAGNLPAALEAGARRIVVVRAITGAADPPRAAAGLRVLLDAVPL
ncbi:thiamine phosphate synthase [soil metagenome]